MWEVQKFPRSFVGHLLYTSYFCIPLPIAEHLIAINGTLQANVVFKECLELAKLFDMLLVNDESMLRPFDALFAERFQGITRRMLFNLEDLKLFFACGHF